MYEDPVQVNFGYPKLLSLKLEGRPMLEMASRDLLADHPISCYQTRREVHWNQTCLCRIFFVISKNIIALPINLESSTIAIPRVIA